MTEDVISHPLKMSACTTPRIGMRVETNHAEHDGRIPLFSGGAWPQ